MGIFSQRIRDERIKSGKKQADLAEYLGTSIPNYSAYENKREPSYAVLCKLADYYNVSTDYLLGRVNDRSNIQESLKRIIQLYEYKIKEAEKIDHEIAARALEILGGAYSLSFALLDSGDLSNPGIFPTDLDADQCRDLFVELLRRVREVIIDFDERMKKLSSFSKAEQVLLRQNTLRQYNEFFSENLADITKLLLMYHDNKVEHLNISTGIRSSDDSARGGK